MTDKPRRRRGCVAYSPMKAPSQLLQMDIKVPDSTIFPAFMSVKHNGMLGCAMVDETGNQVWRSYNQEPINMSQSIREMFSEVLALAQEKEVVLVGEFNSSTYNRAGQTLSILAGSRPCPEDFAFKCFYEVPYSVWNGALAMQMGDMIASPRPYLENYLAVEQSRVDSYEEFLSITERTKDSNLEGYMLLNPRAYWRKGRATVGDKILYKFKYYSDPIDAIILDIEPRKQLKAGLSNKRNPAGYSKRLHGRDNYESTEIGGTLICKLENGSIISAPFPLDTPLEQRAIYYKNKGLKNEYDLLGKWISFSKLAVEDGPGAVSIKGVEFRDGKEEIS